MASPSSMRPRIVAAFDAVAVVAGGVAATIATAGGVSLAIGGLRLGLHAWSRPAIVGLLAAVARVVVDRGRPAGGDWAAQSAALARVVLGATTLSSIGYWLVLLTTVCGGADSYGYVSASQGLLHGRLVQPQPMASWLPVAEPLVVAAPVGYVAAADGSGIAPGYPLGLPLLMAAATWLGGAIGPYLVAPFCGVACLVLAWQLGRQWYGPRAGPLAAALVAWEPLVGAYAKQPMSDIPATMWTLLAVWLLDRTTPRPLLAGIAGGLSFLTRPGGVGALVVLGGLALGRREGRAARTATFALGSLPFVALQAWLQWHLYGSPWRSGYGAVADVFAGQSVSANLAIYGGALWHTHSWVWLVGLVAAIGRRPRPVVTAVAMLALGAVPYLLYWRFDHWETLRFLLPAIALLSIVVAGGVTHIASSSRRWPTVTPWLAAAAAIVVAVTSERFFREQGVPGLRDAEARYPRVADRVAATTPDTSVVFAMQHSGSIRHYADRQTLRWDLVRAEELEPVVAALVSRGHAVYVALEGDEQRQFDERFAAVLPRVRRLPAGQVGIVQIWQLDVSTSP